jgi:hypothetical protein
MKDTIPTLRKIKRGASLPTSQRFCTTFNFAQPHPKPTHHPDKPTNSNNLWNMKKIILLSFLLFTCLTGFSQSYLGRVTKQVNFREGAGTDYPVISSLMDISPQSLPLISLDSLPAFHSKVYH